MDGGLTAAVGGTTLSAGLADSQAQISQAIGSGGSAGIDSLSRFAAAYRASSGGPTLTLPLAGQGRRIGRVE